MMNRREFMRASALVAAGVVAADQLELLDRLAPRRLFAGWSAPKWYDLPLPAGFVPEGWRVVIALDDGAITLRERDGHESTRANLSAGTSIFYRGMSIVPARTTAKVRHA